MGSVLPLQDELVVVRSSKKKNRTDANEDWVWKNPQILVEHNLTKTNIDPITMVPWKTIFLYQPRVF